MSKKTYGQHELVADLEKLHEALLQELDQDFVSLICPGGWKIDHTEHACCERRRFWSTTSPTSKSL